MLDYQAWYVDKKVYRNRRMYMQCAWKEFVDEIAPDHCNTIQQQIKYNVETSFLFIESC